MRPGVEVTYSGRPRPFLDRLLIEIAGTASHGSGYDFLRRERDHHWILASDEEADQLAEDLRAADLDLAIVRRDFTG